MKALQEELKGLACEPDYRNMDVPVLSKLFTKTVEAAAEQSNTRERIAKQIDFPYPVGSAAKTSSPLTKAFITAIYCGFRLS